MIAFAAVMPVSMAACIQGLTAGCVASPAKNSVDPTEAASATLDDYYYIFHNCFFGGPNIFIFFFFLAMNPYKLWVFVIYLISLNTRKSWNE